jgi:hypothetical protein
MGIPATPNEKRRATISKRQKIQREILLTELRKNSVMTVACQKAGIPRSTVYRWINNDTEFMSAIEGASSEGRDVINDMAESVVIKKVREENLHAAKYWLSHNNNRYRSASSRIPLSNFASRQIESLQDMWKFLFDKIRGESKKK